MEEKAIRGIRWTLLGYGTARAASMCTTFVLARLLALSDFGVFAFSSLLVAGFLLVGTLGLESAIVVRQDLGRVQLRTALTLMITLYLGCAAVLAAASPLAADLLNAPHASGVVRGLTIPVAFGGLTSFYVGVMQRELQFSRRFVCVCGLVVANAITSISLAASGVGVWSLVIGQIAGAVVFTALLVTLAPYRVRPGFDRATALSLCRSGWGFMLQGGASFIEQNADYAVIGIKAGPRQLGLYAMAYRIAEIPANFVVEPLGQATFPGFARMRERSEQVGGAFLTTLRLTTLCAFPLGLIMAGAADPLVEAVLGSKWSAMVGLLQILGLWGSLRILQTTIDWFLNAIGFSSRVGMAYTALLVVSIPVLIVAANSAGSTGVAWVMVGDAVAMIAIMSAIAHRQVGVAVRDQWDAVKTSVLAALPAWLSATGVTAGLSGAPAGVALVVSVAAGVGVYVAAVWLMDANLFAEAAAQLRRMRSPRSVAT